MARRPLNADVISVPNMEGDRRIMVEMITVLHPWPPSQVARINVACYPLNADVIAVPSVMASQAVGGGGEAAGLAAVLSSVGRLGACCTPRHWTLKKQVTGLLGTKQLPMPVWTDW